MFLSKVRISNAIDLDNDSNARSFDLKFDVSSSLVKSRICCKFASARMMTKGVQPEAHSAGSFISRYLRSCQTAFCMASKAPIRRNVDSSFGQIRITSTASDLLVESLLQVGVAQSTPVLLRQGHDGYGVIETGVQAGYRFGRGPGELFREFGEMPSRFGDVQRLEDELGRSDHLGAQFGRPMRAQVAHQMNLAGLPTHAFEMLGHRPRQSAVIVGDDRQYASQAAALDPPERLVPGGEALGVVTRDAENLAVACVCIARHDQSRPLYHAFVLAVPKKQRIDKHERSVAFQAALVERPHARIPACESNAASNDSIREPRQINVQWLRLGAPGIHTVPLSACRA